MASGHRLESEPAGSLQARDVRSMPAASTSLARGTKRVSTERRPDMKYMILTYASQQDYDGMAGQASDKPAVVRRRSMAAMGEFMDLLQRRAGGFGRARRDARSRRPRPHPQAAAPGRGPGGHRRAVRRGPGSPRGLLGRGVRELRQGHRDRRPAGIVPGPRARGRATAVADVRPIDEYERRAGGVNGRWPALTSRTCCASWRRRSWAR